jgi:citrate synthase
LIKINVGDLGSWPVAGGEPRGPGPAGGVRVTDWIGAADAAKRLGIKPASLYSYVSRGLLTPRRGPDGRASLFDAAQVASLARRGRPRRAPGGAELLIESELTEISGDHLRFRGHDAIALATSRSFEEVAGLLWTGTFGDAADGPWRATAEAIAAGTAAQAGLPADTYPLERLQVIVPAVAATDRLRLHLDRPAVMSAARSLIAAMVDCLPAAGETAGEAAAGEAPQAAGAAAGRAVGPAAGDGSIAGRLAGRLCLRPPPEGLIGALRAALVLLADHELAASTFAARVAASVRADPYAVVGTGLGAMSGALHGGASLGAEVLLASASGPADAPRVVGELLRRGERIPGLGHFVYRTGDPRAMLLLDLVRAAAPGSGRLAVAEAVVAEAARRALPAPNIEFALAVLVTAAGMVPGSGEAVFAVARTAGWLAHALEEYARATPIRPRGVYTGRPALT